VEEEWADCTHANNITMHVGEAVLSHIMDKKTALNMWNTITTKFSGKGAASAAALIWSICQTRLDDDKDMSVQINDFKENTCWLKNIGYSLHENVLAVMLVNLLPDSYSTVQTILTNSAIKILNLIPWWNQFWLRKALRNCWIQSVCRPEIKAEKG
jgi:hypothetical protein